MSVFIRSIKNIAWLCRPYWKYGKVYLLLSTVIAVLVAPIKDAIYVYFPKAVVDLLVNNKSFHDVALFASVICLLAFMLNILPSLFFCYFQKKRVQIDQKLKEDIYRRSTLVDYKYIDNPEYYNKYTWVLNEYSVQTGNACDFISSFLQYLVSSVVLLTIIGTVGPWVLLIEALQLILHAIIGVRENKIEICRKDEMMPIGRRLMYYHRLFYLRDYAADIRASSLKDFAFSKYEKDGKLNLSLVSKYARKTLLLGVLHESIFVVTEFIVILYIIYNITIGNIPEVGLYITMILAFYRVDSKLQGLISIIKNANSLSQNADKLKEFDDIVSEIETIKPEDGVLPSDSSFSLDLKNVNFNYDNSVFALRNFSLQIKQGEKIAVVGENGAGKSTFIKLLLRLYDVSSGEILINNVSIKDYNLRYLRKKIGVAFQDPNIYAFTFKENLSLYNDVSDSEVIRITEKLSLGNIFEDEQITTEKEITREFEENGIILSGGDAQKIALARIMHGDFGLLLLDEPSSALDPIAEYNISKMILSTANTATTIMVSHRLSSIRDADRIILIENGSIIESGTHDELLALRGKYCEMFTKQSENYLR